MRSGLVRACHDLSEGGVAVAAAEMCIGGRLGLNLSIQAQDPVRALFGETNGCLLVEVRPEACATFEAVLAGMPLQWLGVVSAEPRLEISSSDQQSLLSLPVSELVAAWEQNP